MLKKIINRITYIFFNTGTFLETIQEKDRLSEDSHNKDGVLRIWNSFHGHEVKIHGNLFVSSKLIYLKFDRQSFVCDDISLVNFRLTWFNWKGKIGAGYLVTFGQSATVFVYSLILMLKLLDKISHFDNLLIDANLIFRPKLSTFSPEFIRVFCKLTLTTTPLFAVYMNIVWLDEGS